jgi:hypothetical protein
MIPAENVVTGDLVSSRKAVGSGATLLALATWSEIAHEARPNGTALPFFHLPREAH